MKRTVAFTWLDPVDVSELEHIASSPIFEELQSDIMATPRGTDGPVNDGAESIRLYRHPNHLRPVAASAVISAIVIIAGAARSRRRE